MKGARGIDNPAFVPSSPDTPRRSSASPSQVEVSHAPTEDAQPPKPPEPPLLPPAEPESLALSQFKEGSFGWGRFTPRSLRRCNTPAGFLLHYCVLAVTQGTVPCAPRPAPRAPWAAAFETYGRSVHSLSSAVPH